MTKLIKKGQIVEIPFDCKKYNPTIPIFCSKKEELFWHSTAIKYSLFDGILIGEHSGIENYEIGQRKRINVGGKKAPLYVIEIDKKENRIYVGESDLHPGLYQKVFIINRRDLHWFAFDYENLKSLEINVTFEHCDDFFLEKAIIYFFEEISFIEFQKPIFKGLMKYSNKIKLSSKNIQIAELKITK